VTNSKTPGVQAPVKWISHTQRWLIRDAWPSSLSLVNFLIDCDHCCDSGVAEWFKLVMVNSLSVLCESWVAMWWFSRSLLLPIAIKQNDFLATF